METHQLDNCERLLISIEKLQESLSGIKTSIGILSSKHDGYLLKFDRGMKRMDEHSERLRAVETKQGGHALLFSIFGAVLLACVGGLVNLVLGVG